MKLEDQVVSLDLALSLKELGVKKESYFCWQGNDSTGWYVWASSKSKVDENIYAYSVAELGEMLPDYKLPQILPNDKTVGGEQIRDWRFSKEGEWEKTDTEADARAKMLIYLLEKGLISANQQEE